MTPISPENADMAGFFVKHWERIIAGLLVLIGFIHKTGTEHQKYTDMQKDVIAMKKDCESRLCAFEAMNSNIHLIMGKLNIQPVENNSHRRRED